MWKTAGGQTPNRLGLLLLTFVATILSPADAKFPNEIVEPPIVACEPDRIVIKVRTTTSNPSHIYAEDFHVSPKCTVKNQNEITIPHAECGMTTEHMDNPAGTMFRICISVQIHPFFVTDADRSYCAQCVYMEANVVDDLAQNIAISEMTPNELEPQFDEASNPHCTYSIRKGSVDGSEVHAAVVGDTVFHVWQCNNDNVGILVQNCHVEDLQGDKILIIDQNGCGVDQYLFRTPEYTEDLSTAFLESNVFKFVDKAMTRFRCQLRLCVKRRGHGCDGITPPNSCPRFEEEEDAEENKDTRLSSRKEPTTTTTKAQNNKNNNRKENNNNRMKSKSLPEPENRIDSDAAVIGLTTVAPGLTDKTNEHDGPIGPHAVLAGVTTEIGAGGTTRGTAPSSLRPPPYDNDATDATVTTSDVASSHAAAIWTWSTERQRPKPTRPPAQQFASASSSSSIPTVQSSPRGPPLDPVDYPLSDAPSFDAAPAARAFVAAASTTTNPPPDDRDRAIGPPSIRPFGLSVVSGRTNGLRARDAPSALHNANGTVIVRHGGYTVNRSGVRAAGPPAYAPPSHSPSQGPAGEGHQSGYVFRHRNRRYVTVHADSTVARRVIAKRQAAPRANRLNDVHELDVVGLIRVLDNPEDLEYYSKEQMPIGHNDSRDSLEYNQTATVFENATTTPTTVISTTTKRKETNKNENNSKQQHLKINSFVVTPKSAEQQQQQQQHRQQNHTVSTIAKREKPETAALSGTAAVAPETTVAAVWWLAAGAGALALVQMAAAGAWLAFNRPAALRWRRRVYDLTRR